jgi:hypothetical protein
MTPQILRFSSRVYTGLLCCYPPAYHRRFAAEMAQVFQRMCHDAYRESGARGVLRLWLPVLYDSAWTAAYQWVLSLKAKRRHPMENNPLDRQLSDLIWSISTGLRAGYTLPEVFEVLAAGAPEPAATLIKRFLAELQKEEPETALQNLKQSLPPGPLTRMVDLINLHQRSGGNLADMLDPLGKEMLQQAGSDPAFYGLMRKEAEQLGASLPERVLHEQDPPP